MKSTVSKLDLPTRSAVLSKLASLAAGDISPEEASEWAQVWLLADQTPGTEVQINDWPAWEAIKDLVAADLQVEPGTYLYESEDFRDWYEKLRSSPLQGLSGNNSLTDR